MSTFDQLFDIPKERKNGEYRRYLCTLLEYLQNYIGRVRPLLDLDHEINTTLENFYTQWENGTFVGWPVSISMHSFNRSVF